jgi:hypothetical protein
MRLRIFPPPGLTLIAPPFTFRSMVSEPDQDGQLHTLGLLERLRAESSELWGTSSKLYHRVDALLRELANPNLHDIANMSFRVELWDRHAKHIRWTIAAIGHVTIAQATFDAAVREWPHEHFTLRHGIRLIREHP